MNAKVEMFKGHPIIAKAMAGRSEIFITKAVNRINGRPLYVVNIMHVPPHCIAWSQHDNEADARKSANQAWRRFGPGDDMIAA